MNELFEMCIFNDFDIYFITQALILLYFAIKYF